MSRRRFAVILGLLAMAAIGAAGCDDGGEAAEPPDAVAGFGAEASTAEQEAIATTTERFLAAQADGRWGQACGLMSTAVREQLEGLSASSKQIEGSDCAAVLASVFKQNPAQLQAAADGIEVEAVRIQEPDRGYVFYSTSDLESAYLPLEREGGKWRVATISGSSAPGGD